MTQVTCRLTAKNRDQLRNRTLGNRVWATFTFYVLYARCLTPILFGGWGRMFEGDECRRLAARRHRVPCLGASPGVMACNIRRGRGGGRPVLRVIAPRRPRLLEQSSVTVSFSAAAAAAAWPHHRPTGSRDCQRVSNLRRPSVTATGGARPHRPTRRPPGICPVSSLGLG